MEETWETQDERLIAEAADVAHCEPFDVLPLLSIRG
jgi:hypothetical protein